MYFEVSDLNNNDIMELAATLPASGKKKIRYFVEEIMEQGIEKGLEKAVEKFIIKRPFATNEEIAEIFDISTEHIANIRAAIQPT